MLMYYRYCLLNTSTLKNSKTQRYFTIPKALMSSVEEFMTSKIKHKDTFSPDHPIIENNNSIEKR